MKRQDLALETRNRILLAGMTLIRENGFAATRVEDLCQAAGVTKGGFFHHFKSKEEFAQAAARFFAEYADELFASAPYQRIEDPVKRLLGYLDFREAILQGVPSEYTCLLGTMVQEVHQTHPAIRDACFEHIREHAETLVPTIEQALRQQGLEDAVDARELALFTQTVLQGAFVLAKASQSADVAASGVRHLRHYIASLLGSTLEGDAMTLQRGDHS